MAAPSHHHQCFGGGLDSELPSSSADSTIFSRAPPAWSGTAGRSVPGTAGGLGLPRAKRAPRRSSTPIGHPSSVSSVSTGAGTFPVLDPAQQQCPTGRCPAGGRADGGHLGRALFKCCHEAVQGYSWAGPSAWTSTATTCPRHHPSTIFRERIGASRTRSATIGGRGRYG